MAAAQAMTLFQYNQKQTPKTKATEKGVVLDQNDTFPITRVVLDKRGGHVLVTFAVPRVLSPALGSRLVDMLKFNLEYDNGHHHDNTKYAQDDFVRGVWSLAAVRAPIEIEAV